MTSVREKWTFIVNPVAGNGYAESLLPNIQTIAQKYNIEATVISTQKSGHASHLAMQAYKDGARNIIAVGGDGTFNEIAGSLVEMESVTAGIIPAGTGNDFSQILGFSNRMKDDDWDIFFQRNTIEMDVGYCNKLPFFNGMGLGFDAQVAAENYTAPGEVKKGGKSKYLYHILKTLLFYEEKRMTILSNPEQEETDCFINTVSIGRRFAGDFFLTPNAIANDGLLDVCMIKNLSLPQRLKILTMVPKGTHINDKKVKYYQTDGIELSFKEEVPFHLDGELNFASHFDITILPKALKVIYNPGGRHFFHA
jgi:YegS/Rv2252/BmrU family lipid kinase